MQVSEHEVLRERREVDRSHKAIMSDGERERED